jgi:hypothetical protein
MGFTIGDRHSGVETAWATAAGGVDFTGKGGSKGNWITDEDVGLLSHGAWLRAFTHLSYDPARDLVIVTNGEGWPDHGGQPGGFRDYPIYGIRPPLWTHVAFAAGSLLPTQDLAVSAVAGFLFPISGSCAYFTPDLTTGTLSDQHGVCGRLRQHAVS